MARTTSKTSSADDLGGEPDTTTASGAPEETGGPAPSGGDQAPAVVTSAEGHTRPLVDAPPLVPTPEGMEEVNVTEPEPDPAAPAAPPATSEERPFLLRIAYPYDRYVVPGMGEAAAGGGERGDLVLTRTYTAVSQEQLDAARVATRGTGIKLFAARPKKTEA